MEHTVYNASIRETIKSGDDLGIEYRTFTVLVFVYTSNVSNVI